MMNRLACSLNLLKQVRERAHDYDALLKAVDGVLAEWHAAVVGPDPYIKLPAEKHPQQGK